MSSALISIHGGLVLAVADDPGMHSSQNEQDSRNFADFAKVICLEPADHQEAYDMTREGFVLSEKYQMPVVLRMVTRLAHSRGVLIPRSPTAVNPVNKAPNPQSWILLPNNARRQWRERLLAESTIQKAMAASPFNQTQLGSAQNVDLGVITTGTARNYFLEVAPELKTALKAPFEHVHIGAYPMPAEAIRELGRKASRLLILEDGYPFVEKLAHGLGLGSGGPKILGRMTGELPGDGELNPDLVRKALGLPVQDGRAMPELPGRPPQLCPGCPHIDSYASIKNALSSFGARLVTADIGCSTLGAMPEYNAIESCVCMGASIGMAKGASEAGLSPVVAVIGDSTFLHSGMTALVDAIAANANMTVMILDNETVGMTGGQTTILPSSRLKDVILGLGVNPEHLHVLHTHRTKVQENSEIIRHELHYPGLSVIIARRECIETAKKKPMKEATP